MYGTLEDKNRFVRGSNIKVASSIGLAVLGGIIMAVGDTLSLLGAILTLLGAGMMMAGALFWFWGLALYNRSKGYPASGAVLGLLGIFGLLMLAARPDRFVTEPAQDSIYPRSPTPGY
jgi:hypothetical protein